MNYRKGDKVSIITYNPPLEATVADYYELPFEQVPMDNETLIRKYYGKKVPIVEVFNNGKLLSFVADIVKKN
tara:strand:- start:313 stop:528 length:216 start_codon:yes stop_codon:yes gene_type:complete